jgi:hypothetical protein
VACLDLKLGSERFPVEDLLHHQEIFQRSDVDVIFYRNTRLTGMEFECRMASQPRYP